MFQLTRDEAFIAKGMLARGDDAFDVAYWFGVDEAEIEELSQRKIFDRVTEAAFEDLPPPGPYPSIRAVRAAIFAIERALSDLNVARETVGLTACTFFVPSLDLDPRRSLGAPISESEDAPPRARKADTKPPTVTPPRERPSNPKYQPQGRKSAPPSNRPGPTQTEPSNERALPIHVRLLMERGGFCRLTLIPRRATEMPFELEVDAEGKPLTLSQSQEDWFDDVCPEKLGDCLHDGTAWSATLAEGPSFRWVLSGREVFVLGHHDNLAGFVSKAKVSLHQAHIVLCTESHLPKVMQVISEGGSPAPVVLGRELGMPDGWVGLHGVIPRIPIASTEGPDILNVLRADADVEILLEGGIRVARSAWLLGHPPQIRILGQLASGDESSVDGIATQRDAAGYIEVDGIGKLGDHNVACGNLSRSYRVVEGLEQWQPWEAYSWPVGANHPIICGPLVRPSQTVPIGNRTLLLPITNGLVLGASPGEIFRCDSRADVAAAQCVAFPSFDPIWALPATILHCDKQTINVLFLGDLHKVDSLGPHSQSRQIEALEGAQARRKKRREIALWCSAIRDAGRKGLLTQPTLEGVASLWRQYKKYAKSLRRSMR